MITLTSRCVVWSFALAVIATKESSQTGISHNSVPSIEVQDQLYSSNQQPVFPRDCAEVLLQCPSRNASAVHAIKPDGFPGVFDVYCDGDGYTLIARRSDGRVSFNRSWEDYTSGFGFLSNDFWLGNQRLSYLTNQKIYQLLIDVTLNDGSGIRATYDNFCISDTYSNFELIATELHNIDGGWRYWTPWTPYSVTCGGGVKRRHSRCTDGAACVEDTEEERCNAEDCILDGGWSEWSDWTECPVTCGGGERVRKRACSNPAPQYGGLDCTGRAQEKQDCGTNPCPVHGGWSSWSDWTQCTLGCESQQVRERACDNPVPHQGGQPCTGDAQENQECLAVSCQSSTIRLADGPNSYSGKVEVFVDGEWGTVMDFGWNNNQGDVACRQMGFVGGAAYVSHHARFGRGVLRIYMAYPCSGSEARLIDCYFSLSEYCSNHGNDVGVTCRRTG